MQPVGVRSDGVGQTVDRLLASTEHEVLPPLIGRERSCCRQPNLLGFEGMLFCFKRWPTGTQRGTVQYSSVILVEVPGQAPRRYEGDEESDQHGQQRLALTSIWWRGAGDSGNSDECLPALGIRT